MKLVRCLTPYTKVNSKWIKDLNVHHETIKLLEKNIGKNLLEINMSDLFTDISPWSREIKAKMHKWDYIKLKSFCSKGHHQENKKASYSMGEYIHK